MAKRTKRKENKVGNERKGDLAHVEGRLRELGDELQRVQRTYQTYHGEVQETIKGIMVKAGVFEEINALERERAEAGQRAQQKVQALQEEANGLQKIRAFLVGRERAEEPEPEKVPVEESPKEVPSDSDISGEISGEISEPSEETAETEADKGGEEAKAVEDSRPSPPNF